jgi:hypothetical protein
MAHGGSFIWRAHFSWSEDGTTLLGLTSVGRATIIAVQLKMTYAYEYERVRRAMAEVPTILISRLGTASPLCLAPVLSAHAESTMRPARITRYRKYRPHVLCRFHYGLSVGSRRRSTDVNPYD